MKRFKPELEVEPQGKAMWRISVRQKFTQKERDIESGLDYFGARYYSSAQGRFTSVDPGGFSPRNLVSPQDWNRLHD